MYDKLITDKCCRIHFILVFLGLVNENNIGMYYLHTY